MDENKKFDSEEQQPRESQDSGNHSDKKTKYDRKEMIQRIIELHRPGFDVEASPNAERYCPPPIGDMHCPWGFLSVLIIISLSSVLPRLVYTVFPGRAGSISLDFLAYGVQTAGFLLLPMFVAYFGFRLPSRALGFGPIKLKKALEAALMGAGLYLLGMLLSLISVLILPEQLLSDSGAVDLLGKSAGGLEIGVVLLFFLFLAPFAEEILFRAYALPPLLSRRSPQVGLLIQAILFSLMHLNPQGFLALLAGGYGFGWIYLRYKNIKYCIIAHSTWNIIAVVLYFSIY